MWNTLVKRQAFKSFNIKKYQSARYVPGPVLGAGGIAVDKTDKNRYAHGSCILTRGDRW